MSGVLLASFSIARLDIPPAPRVGALSEFAVANGATVEVGGANSSRSYITFFSPVANCAYSLNGAAPFFPMVINVPVTLQTPGPVFVKNSSGGPTTISVNEGTG